MILEGKPEDNIFEKNPGIEYLPLSQDLIKEYKKEKASKILWALYMVYHPESKIFHSNLKDKITSISKSYLNLSLQKGEELLGQWTKRFIQEFIDDPIAKLLSLVKIKFDEYFNAVAFLDFDVVIKDDKTLMQKNKLKDLSEYHKMIEEFESMQKKYTEKKDTGQLYGNITESLRELRYRIGKKS